MRTVSAIALWLVASCGGGGGTELVVVVTTDLRAPCDFDRVRVRVTAPGSDAYDMSPAVGPDALPLPLSLVVVQASPDVDDISIEVEAYRSGARVLAQTATALFVPGERRVVRMHLARACLGVDCGDARQSCFAGACAGLLRETERFEGLPDPDPSMACDGPRDGGAAADAGRPDAAADAGPDAGGLDGGAMDAGRPDAGASDAGPGPMPVRPCRAGASCWTANRLHPDCPAHARCDGCRESEDFSTGMYGVHVWETTLYAPGVNVLRLIRGTTLEPVLIVVEADDTVLFDGDVGLVRPGLEIGASLAVDSVELQVRTDRDLPVRAFVTDRVIVDAGFVGMIDTTATYTLDLEHDCDG